MPRIEYLTLWVHRRNVVEVAGQVGYVQAERGIAQVLIARGVAVDLLATRSSLPYVEGWHGARAPSPSPSPSESSSSSGDGAPGPLESADHEHAQSSGPHRAAPKRPASALPGAH